MTGQPITVVPMPSVQDLGDRGAVSGFAKSDLTQIAKHAIADGLVTREQADDALRAEGIEPPAPPDPTLGPAAAEIDAAFPVPADPSEYRLPPLGDENTPVADLARLDGLARGWLHEARLPVEIGHHLVSEAVRGADRYAAMSEDGRNVYAAQERAKLDRILGPDAAARIDKAKRLVQDLEARKPGLLAVLRATGAGNNANVIAQLVLHAERLEARRQ